VKADLLSQFCFHEVATKEGPDAISYIAEHVVILSNRVQHLGDDRRQLLPVCHFVLKLPESLLCQFVISGAPVVVGRS
jgi:hypothetical protein